jgi:hypothetical protein
MAARLAAIFAADEKIPIRAPIRRIYPPNLLDAFARENRIHGGMRKGASTEGIG